MGILAGPVKAFVAGMAGIGTALGGVISGIKPMISTLGAVNNQVALMPRLLDCCQNHCCWFWQSFMGCYWWWGWCCFNWCCCCGYACCFVLLIT